MGYALLKILDLTPELTILVIKGVQRVLVLPERERVRGGHQEARLALYLFVDKAVLAFLIAF